jgi:hypothetical protein
MEQASLPPKTAGPSLSLTSRESDGAALLEELPRQPTALVQGKRLSIAETLRMRRLRIYEQDRDAARTRPCEIATDIDIFRKAA